MSNTYKAERELKERENQFKAGVTGIPFIELPFKGIQ